VVASLAGISLVAIASSSTGLFMEPLNQEFGWSRAQVAAGLTIFAAVAVPLSPLVGAMIDRWGARRLAIPGIILSSTAFASFGWANGSTMQWLGLWAIYSVVAVFIRNTVWSAAVSGTFNASRGLALGFTLSGTAFSAALVPIIAQRLIEGYGWRKAYLLIGSGWGAVVLLLVFFFFFDARDRLQRQNANAKMQQAEAPVTLPGLPFAQALRDPALIKIAVATMIITMLNSALYVHLVPILNERALNREAAAAMAGLAGVMAIVGRLLTGWLLDRWESGWINAISLGLPGIACLILLFADVSLPILILTVVIIGYTLGSFMQVCVYLTGRYGGIRNFGKIFGVISSLIALGPGIGPLLAGFAYDLTGSYNLLFIAGIPIGLLAGALVFALGPYPNWSEPSSVEPA